MSLAIRTAGSRGSRRAAVSGALVLFVTAAVLAQFPAFHTDGHALPRAGITAPGQAGPHAAASGASHASSPHDCLACVFLGLSAVLAAALSPTPSPAPVSRASTLDPCRAAAPALSGPRSRAPPAV